MQTSRLGLCCLLRLISLIAPSILVPHHERYRSLTNDFSTIASSQQLIFTPCFFPSSNHTSIIAASSRQEVFQIALGAGNDTYALLMGNNRNRISLVDTNFFTFKNLSHLGLYDRIAPLEVQVFDVNATETNTQMTEILARSKTRFGDLPVAINKIILSDVQKRFVSLLSLIHI